jgi:putative transposase
MPDYRRAFSPGGTFFFTLVTYARRPLFSDPANRDLLRSAIETCRLARPFTIDAFVLLPDHLHAVWTLPSGDSDYSIRWSLIKKSFTRSFLATGGHDRAVSASRRRNRRRGVWQRRFWEHVIRDTDDYNAHLDYTHYNPVKHGHAACPHLYPFSSFARHVALNNYPPDWHCACHDPAATPPSFYSLPVDQIE